jgi:hypothetical protein
MKSPTITGRHALVSLAALALTGSALAVGAGPASAAPADPDLTGAVVNAANAGLAGISVVAYTTPATGAPQYVTSATTDATGHYTFTGLDPASLAANPDPAIASETEFKLYFYWYPPTAADFHTTGYLNRGLGGTKTIRAAGSVVVPAGATATAPTQALPTAGGVLLKVLGATGAPVTEFGAGTLYEPDAYDPLNAVARYGSTSSDDDFYPDGPDVDTEPDAPDDGLVYIWGVEPGLSYAVQATGADDVAGSTSDRSYISRFFGGDGTYTKATPVKVSVGAFTPVTVQLTDALTPLEEPRIIGNSSFGSKLTVEPGTWLGPPTGGSMIAKQQPDVDYTYQWLRGSTVVGTGPTYKVTKKDKKAKIRVAVTAYRAEFVGTAVSDPTSKVGEKSKVSVRKAGAGKYAVTVKVAKKKLAQKLGVPTGKVVLITEDGSLASKKVRLQGGQATLVLKAKYAGEKLWALYLGNSRLGSDTAAVKGGKKKG